jgi:hypothetical protein
MTSSNWTSRFGTLKDVVVRKTRTETNYATFTIKTPNFEAMGTTFAQDVVTFLQKNIGNKVRLNGVMEERTLEGGRKVNTFKALRVAQKL